MIKRLFKSLLVGLLFFCTVNFLSYSENQTYLFQKSVGNWNADSQFGYTMGTPVGIYKNSKNHYYVADMANGRILVLDRYMNKIDTINHIDMPLYVYVDNEDNVLVCELGTNSILKFNPEHDLIQTWGGEGIEEGLFQIPRSIVQDSKGYYYVSDELNHRIQKFDIDGNFVASYGQYGEELGEFKVQQGLSIDSKDRLYVADTYNNRIQIIETNPTWKPIKSFGKFGIYEPFNYFSFQSDIMNHPRAVFVDKSSGRIAVTDSSNNRVMVYTSIENGLRFSESQNGYLGMALPTHAIIDNGFLKVLDSHSRILSYTSRLNNTNLFAQYEDYRNKEGMFSNPQTISVNPIDNTFVVSDSFNHRLQVFDADGNYIRDYGGIGGPNGMGTLLNYFFYPKQTTFNDEGTLYVADFTNGRVVYKSMSNASFYTEASYDLELPWGVAHYEGRLYVSDWGDDHIKVYENGRLLHKWGGQGEEVGRFKNPSDLLIGNYRGEVALFVVDTGNNRVQVFDLQGSYIGLIGAPESDPLNNYLYEKLRGSLLLPYGIAQDKLGNILVSDTSHKCIRIFSNEGILIDTFGEMSITEGNFFSPMGIAINKNTGKLYVADGVLQRVQIFDKK